MQNKHFNVNDGSTSKYLTKKAHHTSRENFNNIINLHN